MLRLALACSAGREDFAGEAPPLVAALEDVGIHAEAVVWDDAAADWSGYDGVAIRATWDYIERIDEFRTWIDRVNGLVPLTNPAAVVHWNTDKAYLTDLSDAGVAIIPTTFLGPGTGIGLADLPHLDHWPELVVKPTVSAGARLSGRFGPEERAAGQVLLDLIHGEGLEAMLQPYLDAVDTQGETDVVVIGGRPSHAVAKGGVLQLGVVPALDEYQAEDQWHRPTPLTDELVDFTMQVLAAVPHDGPLLYARVDSVLAADGTRLLMELELVEPYLFVDDAPDPGATAARFASEVHRWLTTAAR